MLPFLHFPDRTGDAPDNMATDFLLLQRFDRPETIRFRHYDWRRPAVTFGYSQKSAFVTEYSPADRVFCRRPTGGGIVDHLNDWTYSLVLPRQHPLWERPAPLAYQLLHETLAAVLRQLGQNAGLQMPASNQKRDTGPEICFTKPEVHDVIQPLTGQKIAGAALKRNKHGLLFQGSIDRTPLPNLDWQRFAADFPTLLAERLEAEPEETGWPNFDPDEEMALSEQFASPEWNERR